MRVTEVNLGSDQKSFMTLGPVRKFGRKIPWTKIHVTRLHHTSRDFQDFIPEVLLFPHWCDHYRIRKGLTDFAYVKSFPACSQKKNQS